MTEIGWMLVALVAMVLAYDILRRHANGDMVAQRARLITVEAKVGAYEQLFADAADALELERSRRLALDQLFTDHVKTFNEICQQWRAKVGELEAKCDSVVANAGNELAGILAQAKDNNQKGWR